MPTRGFTLLELMIALAVLGLLLGIGIPAFGTVIDRQRMDSGLDALIRSVNYTRMEAVRRNRPVTMAPIDDDWNSGWRIFIDANHNGRHDQGENILREEVPANVSYIHANTPVAHYVRFNAQGESVLLNGGFQAGTFRFCPERAAEGRQLIINRVGRARVERRVIGPGYCPE